MVGSRLEIKSSCEEHRVPLSTRFKDDLGTVSRKDEGQRFLSDTAQEISPKKFRRKTH